MPKTKEQIIQSAVNNFRARGDMTEEEIAAYIVAMRETNWYKN